MNTLVVIDVQKDFVNGRLANPAAQDKMPDITKKIQNWDGPVIFTQDTHSLETFKYSKEGCLPLHCCPAVDDEGWDVMPEAKAAAENKTVDFIEKPTFGCLDWYESENPELERVLDQAESITVIGFVSEICVIANLIILRAMFPDKKIVWDSTCSAGLLNDKGEQPGHEAAKIIAKAQQIEVVE